MYRLSSDDKTNQIVPQVESRTLDVDQNQAFISIKKGNDVEWNTTTNCPNGLKKRNVDFNHIYSPFWMQKKRKDDSEEPITADDGFESFNGSEDAAPTTLLTVSKCIF